MASCTLKNVCEQGSAQMLSSPYCSSFSLLTEICITDDMMGMGGCKDYKSMCQQGSSVKQCHLNNNTLLNMPNTKVSQDSVHQMCEMMSMADCSKCENKSCDYLRVYSDLCISMPGMGGCAAWKQMCISIPNWPLCTNTPQPSANNCISQPSNQTCVNYEYPDTMARSDINELCSEMPNMPGCTLSQLCTTGVSSVKSSVYCKPIAVLTEICTDDMMSMSGCANYSSMCKSNSVVSQCHMSSDALLALPSSDTAENGVKGICSRMTMAGCAKCKSGQCDYLTVYSDLCISMPNMKECSSWKNMCTYVPDWPLCSAANSNSDDAVEMRMYFHTDYYDYILFKQWVPRSNLGYALSVVAVFFATLFHDGIRLLRSLMERRWQNDGYSDISYRSAPPFRLSVDLPRALLQFVDVMWGLFIMLIAMTYNVGLVITIGAGYFMGTLMFGRYMRHDPLRATSSTCH